MSKKSGGAKNDRPERGSGSRANSSSTVWEWVIGHEFSVASNIMLTALNYGSFEATLAELVERWGGDRGVVLRAIRLLEKRGWLAVQRQDGAQAWKFRSLAVPELRAHELN